jgi:hypothetical protein
MGSDIPTDYLSQNAIEAISCQLDQLLQEQEADPFIWALKNHLLSQTLPNNPQLQALVQFYNLEAFIWDHLI